MVEWLQIIQYTYNANGQLIKEVSKGDYKWTQTYTL